jgi:hypothetical protein
MATSTASAPVRRRGRPRKDESAPQKRAFSGGIVEQVRSGLRNAVGVCETCGHTVNPIQPVADQIGISPVILAKFIRGESGVSMDTLDAMYGFVLEQQKNAEQNENSEPQTEATPA